MQHQKRKTWRIKIDFMKRGSTIHNLDTLEKEIYRLKLEARLKEVKLTDNWEKLFADFPEILTNSLFCRNREKENGKETFGQRLFNNEKRSAFVDRIVDKFSDSLADKIDELFEKVFHKHK
jgi:hypothetical protein